MQQFLEQQDLRFYKIELSNRIHLINFDLNICYWIRPVDDTSVTRVWRIRRRIAPHDNTPYWQWFDMSLMEGDNDDSWKDHYTPFSEKIEQIYLQHQAEQVLVQGVTI